MEVKMNKVLIKSNCFRVTLIGLWSLAFSVIPVHSQVTFNPTAKVTLGGSQPGSVIGAGTISQIVRTTTFFFNLRDDLPSSRTMSFDTGVLNMNAITLGTRLFETTLVISASSITQAMTARIGHTVSSLTQNSATLVGTIEATTIDPLFALFLGNQVQIIQAVIGSVGMNGSISANAEGFSYTDSFNVPNDTVSEDVQSFFQFQAVVTDTFPADLYTTPQLDGTLTVSNDLTSLTGLTSGPILDQFTVSESAPSEFETILIANFANGNNAALNSRVYLFNPSESGGEVTVRVFTLPLIGGTAQELTVEPFNLGTLEARSALNIKLAEDILTLLEIPLPYTDNGGNLTLEFTIQAANVRGTAQVFSSDFAFGTYPLQEIPSSSAGSPTVLVASFLNGNDSAFNSRVYLWNPSESAGSVTVRVFTLPIGGGLAQELTTAPLNLETLAAKSGLNIKVAEDILTLLGITPPYTTDGGNLTLEFTIEAADVVGAAQVFSSGFAFGTYPLAIIQ
jgi:hypothetical protein